MDDKQSIMQTQELGETDGICPQIPCRTIQTAYYLYYPIIEMTMEKKKSKLNLSDFNVENQNVIASEPQPEKQEKPIKQTRRRAEKQEKLTQKMQVMLTEEEYDILYSQFEDSGFPTFSSYLRKRLRDIKFI